MAAEYQSVGLSPGTSSTTCVIAAPASIAAGDLLLATVTSKSETAISPPANWTAVAAAQVTTSFNTANFYKVADAGDAGASNFTFTCGSESNTGVMIRVTGQSTGTILGTPVQAFGSGTAAHAAATVTMQSAASLYVCFAGANNDADFGAMDLTCTSNGASLDQYTKFTRGRLDTTTGSDCSSALYTATWSGLAEGGSSGACSGLVTPSTYGNTGSASTSSVWGTWVVVYAASDASALKTVNGEPKAEVKTVLGEPIAEVRSYNGLV